MNKPPLIKRTLFFLLALDLFILVFLTIFFLQMNDTGYYAEHFADEGVNEQFNDPSYPLRATQAILDYYQGKTASFSYEGFTENEKSHITDVKAVLWKFKALLMVSLLIFICLLFYLASTKGFFSRTARFMQFSSSFFFRLFMVACLLALSFFLITLLLANNFSSFFTAFHQTLFPAGNWMFSSTDTLIVLFPESFFMDFFMNVALNTLLFLIALFLISSLMYLLLRKKGKSSKEKK